MRPEPISQEFVPAEGVPAPPGNAAEVALPDKITDIAQLPSIWRLDGKIEWLIDELIPLGGITLIAAESGAGKTYLAYAIAGAVSRGVPFAGCAVQQRPVIYLDGENPLCVVKERLLQLGIPETANLHIWGGWIPEHPHGPESALLRKFAQGEKPLLIWDSLVQFHSGNEQQATETRAFMNHFRALANVGATVLILHHTGKVKTASQYRGSSDIKAAVDTAYVLRSPASENGKLTWLILQNFKCRFAPGTDIGLVFQPGEGFRPSDIPKGPARKTPEAVIRDILTERPNINGKRIKELAKLRGVGKNNIDDALRDGNWHRTRGTGRAILYALSATARRNAEIPTPIGEGNREIEPSPAEEVA
jgi:hypothetical protein